MNCLEFYLSFKEKTNCTEITLSQNARCLHLQQRSHLKKALSKRQIGISLSTFGLNQ